MKNNNVQVAESNLIPRPPIVVVLGHVDHGKTTLLDYIRHTKVADKETGAITQHIGAYEITVNPSGNNPQETRPRNITFLDTPGHEAFSKIRSRGAKAADIAILVVAADEGVKPQTQEAFQHIQSAGLPFIVAINKIDKPTANPDKVKRELTEIGIYLEGWGGDVPFCEISAKTGQGINELLELILLLADLNELKADPLAPASGLVIDAYLDSKRGYTATLLITNGTLQLNDKIVAGQVLGKIKILEDFQGHPIKKASFSSPVRVIGFEQLPLVGEKFYSGRDEVSIIDTQEINNLSNYRMKVIGDPNNPLKVPTIIKADVIGSAEAVIEILKLVSNKQQVSFQILNYDVGDVSEEDIKMANPNGTLILAFRVKVKKETTNLLSANSKLIILQSDLIYSLEKQIIEIIQERFLEKPTEEILGSLEVLAIFNPIKGNQLIGGRVISGEIRNKGKFKLIRNEEAVTTGRILNLQKRKVDTDLVKQGEECGLLVECDSSLQKGDVLEIFQKI